MTKGFYDEAMETMSCQEREKYSNHQLQRIIQHAYKNAPAVKERLDKAGVDRFQIRTVKDLEKIPVLRKAELIELQKANPPFGGFLALPRERVERFFISPGPAYEPSNPLEVHVAQAKGLYAAGFREGDVIMNTFSYHMMPAGLGIDKCLRLLGAIVVPTGVGNTEMQVQIMHDLEITGYVGAGSFLMDLIRKADELGYNFCNDFSLRVALLGGEMLSSSLRKSLEQDYGISTRQFYACAEWGLLAYECSEKSGMHILEEVITEIIDPATGRQLGPNEVGEVALTFLNEAYPLIRFSPGDLSCYIDNPCPCGRTSNKLARLVGRVGDGVRIRSLFLYPKVVEDVISKFPEISKAQLVVCRIKHRDEMTLRLELQNENIEKERLSEDLGRSFRERCKLRLDRIEFLAKGIIPGGHKTIVDERTWE